MSLSACVLFLGTKELSYCDGSELYLRGLVGVSKLYFLLVFSGFGFIVFLCLYVTVFIFALCISLFHSF
jgi:hypothetical protein